MVSTIVSYLERETQKERRGDFCPGLVTPDEFIFKLAIGGFKHDLIGYKLSDLVPYFGE